MKLATKPLSACLAAVFCATTSNARAQVDDPQPPTPPATATPAPAATAPTPGAPFAAALARREKEFPGISWGSFRAYPEVSLAATYDDNLYAERTNPVDDVVYTLSPAFALKSDWKRHAFNLDAGADFDRYRTHEQEDVDDYWVGFDGHYDFTPRGNLFAGARHSRDHEDRGAPGALDPSAQLEPTRYDHEEAHLGVAHAFGAWRTRVGGTFDQYDYRDGRSSGGAIVDADYRDHDLHAAGVRLGYVFRPRYELFAQVAADTRSYDNPIPGQTFDRDSDGYRAAAGLKFTPIPRQLTGEAYAGVMRQDFDYAGFSDVSKPYFGAVVVWQPTDLLTATGFIDRSLEETVVYVGDDYASSSIDTTYGIEVERRVTSRLAASARAAYTRSDFQSFERLDKIIDAGAGLHYYVAPTVYVGADLRVIDRDSDELVAQYSRNQFLVSVGYTPARNRDYSIIPENAAGAPAAPRPRGAYSGFYLGGALGYGALTSDTFGLRGETLGDENEGTDEANMGGFGLDYALFAGWGAQLGNAYLGVEIDRGDSHADWTHSKAKPAAPTTFVEQDDSWGASLRAGYALDGGLVYAKAGVVHSDFHSHFAVNQYAAGGYDRTNDARGVRLGVGLEVPASARLFVRTDYSHTRYGDYPAPHQASADGDVTAETFDNRTGVFSIGAGWRFGGARPALAARAATTLDGLYAGAALGHATLATELTGPHNDGGALGGPFAFAGDFADSGFAGGFFAGYGHTFRQLYLGIEVDAEAANFGWEHERVSGGGGRDFAAERRGGYGGDLRLGYVLGNGSLLYGRAGAVRTRFNTFYSKGRIDRSDRLDGTRVGLGAEIPAAENAFVRVDYSYTHYDDTVDFATATDRVDAMRFDTRETLARLALGVRF